MDFNEFRYKVSRMSPLKRAFTSAAIGVGAFGAVALTGMVSPGLATVAGLAATLGGSMLVSSYSDPSSGPVGPLPISKDSLLNIGAFFGSYIFVAPKLVGMALSFALAASPLPSHVDLPALEAPAEAMIQAAQPSLKPGL